VKYRIQGKFTKQEQKVIHQTMAALACVWHCDLIWTIRRARCDRHRCFATVPLSLFPVFARDVADLAAKLPGRACELSEHLRLSTLSGNVAR
jgi:hypothetical protein